MKILNQHYVCSYRFMRLLKSNILHSKKKVIGKKKIKIFTEIFPSWNHAGPLRIHKYAFILLYRTSCTLYHIMSCCHRCHTPHTYPFFACPGDLKQAYPLPAAQSIVVIVYNTRTKWHYETTKYVLCSIFTDWKRLKPFWKDQRTYIYIVYCVHVVYTVWLSLNGTD